MLNVVMPIAGEGKRFVEKGYTFPKPLIEIKGRPMIEIVIKNVVPDVEHRFIFICRKEHVDHYNLFGLLKFLSPGCEIITIERTTQGAACTVLLAKEFIDSTDDLLIANTDQYIDMDIDDFTSEGRRQHIDGFILTFHSTHPKWSFARIDKNGCVIEVAEKNPISDNATAGIYYFKNGSDFVHSAEHMIQKNIRVNNEFYVCPVYNEMLLADKKIKIYDIPKEKMHCLGTPEDLEEFYKSDIYQKL